MREGVILVCIIENLWTRWFQRFINFSHPEKTQIRLNEKIMQTLEMRENLIGKQKAVVVGSTMHLERLEDIKILSLKNQPDMI